MKEPSYSDEENYPTLPGLLGNLWFPSVLLIVLFVGSFLVGEYPVTFKQLIALVSTDIFGGHHDVPAVIETVIFRSRLPRLVAAVLVGGALAAAGATYQAIFRNPLVSPDILGVSGGAALGAALGTSLSLSIVGIQLLAFMFALGTVFLVYILSQAVRGRDPILALVLAGVVMGALAAACVSLLKVLADPYDQLPATAFWLLGSLASVNLNGTAMAIPLTVIGLVPLYLLRRRMDLMSRGDEQANARGVDVVKMRITFVCAATLITASAVSISGIIGWVGLMIPHVARMLVGAGFSRLLPAAMMLGAGYLLLVDDLARTIAPIEVPLGVLTAFFGAPFFIWLLVTNRRG
jgi:iron complex transport system permease protein